MTRAHLAADGEVKKKDGRESGQQGAKSAVVDHFASRVDKRHQHCAGHFPMDHAPQAQLIQGTMRGNPSFGVDRITHIHVRA